MYTPLPRKSATQAYVERRRLPSGTGKIFSILKFKNTSSKANEAQCFRFRILVSCTTIHATEPAYGSLFSMNHKLLCTVLSGVFNPTSRRNGTWDRSINTNCIKPIIVLESSQFVGLVSWLEANSAGLVYSDLVCISPKRDAFIGHICTCIIKAALVIRASRCKLQADVSSWSHAKARHCFIHFRIFFAWLLRSLTWCRIMQEMVQAGAVIQPKMDTTL